MRGMRYWLAQLAVALRSRRAIGQPLIPRRSREMLRGQSPREASMHEVAEEPARRAVYALSAASTGRRTASTSCAS